jgi:hypothetical protein
MPSPSDRPGPRPAEGVARLSPLKHQNVNVLGRYSFTAALAAAMCTRHCVLTESIRARREHR